QGTGTPRGAGQRDPAWPDQIRDDRGHAPTHLGSEAGRRGDGSGRHARRGRQGRPVPGERSVVVHDRNRPGGHRRATHMTTREAVICEPARTPIARYGGMFASLTAVELGVTALKGLLDRTGIAPDTVDDVILGHCYPNSDAPAIG